MQSTTEMPARSLGTLPALRGSVIRPEDAAYDRARAVFYGGIDKRPAAIVRVADVADVQRVVAMARDGDHELAVRSGGHSIAGHGTTNGGVVLDLRDMAKVEIDAVACTAWVETGATALQVTKAAAEHGLVVGFGDSGSVGVGGITLGGGIGFLVRKHGLTIDSLLAAELVTADGRHLHTDAERYPELFWAIRGGGGNFGVVTRLKFRLHELKQFTGGVLVLPAPRHCHSERRREAPRHCHSERRREAPRHCHSERRREAPRCCHSERRREAPEARNRTRPGREAPLPG